MVKVILNVTSPRNEKTNIKTIYYKIYFQSRRIYTQSRIKKEHPKLSLKDVLIKASKIYKGKK